MRTWFAKLCPPRPVDSETKTQHRGKLSRKRKTLYALLVFTLVLTATEWTLRATLGPPPPPVKVYAGLQKPSTWFVEKDGKVHATYDINKAGDRPVPVTPFLAEWRGQRVAYVGGSTVRGGRGNVPAQLEFSAQTQKLSRIQSVNVGQPGLDSHDLSRLVDDLLQWDFSAIVLYTGHNDFGNAYFFERFKGARGGQLAKAKAFLEGFHTYVQLKLLFEPWKGRGSIAVGAEYEEKKPGLTRARSNQTTRYLEANLRRIAHKCRQANVPLFLIVPISDASRIPALQGVPLTAPPEAQNAVRRVGKEKGVYLIDPELSLEKSPRFTGPHRRYFSDVVHLSFEGNRALAELLAPEIKKILRP